MKAKYLVLDVDGTLTDGKIYMSNNGELFKVFDVKDGCAIHDILPNHGGETIIMTARSSEILKKRCDELNIKRYYQGVRNKKERLIELAEELGLEKNENGKYKNIAYMGDDIIDLPPMSVCEYVGAPCDAANEVKENADFVSTRNGGNGAVREFVEYLCR